MDLVQTILRSSGFGEYHDIFKENGVDSFSLKLLTDKDLQLLGIEDEKKREDFLKTLHNLQIPSEKKIPLTGDSAYALLFLNQMSFHVQKQFANLTYMLKREDVDICDVRLTPAVLTLQTVLSHLQQKIGVFEYKLNRYLKPVVYWNDYKNETSPEIEVPDFDSNIGDK